MLYDHISNIVIIRKNKRANPPCGNLYKEYCFTPPTCVKHAAEIKAELRGKDIKGARVRTSVMFCVFSDFTTIQMVLVTGSHKVWEEDNYSVWLCVAKLADIFYWHVSDIFYWHVADTFCQWCQTCCAVMCPWEERLQHRQRDTERQRVVLLFCQLSPFWFPSVCHVCGSKPRGSDLNIWQVPVSDPWTEGWVTMRRVWKEARASQRHFEFSKCKSESEVVEFDSKSRPNALMHEAR